MVLLTDTLLGGLQGAGGKKATGNRMRIPIGQTKKRPAMGGGEETTKPHGDKGGTRNGMYAGYAWLRSLAKQGLDVLSERGDDNSGDVLYCLPDELVYAIAFYLPSDDLVRLGATCRRLYGILDDQRIWRDRVRCEALASPEDLPLMFAVHPPEGEPARFPSDRCIVLPVLPDQHMLDAVGRDWRWLYTACRRDDNSGGPRVRPWTTRIRYPARWGILVNPDTPVATACITVGDMDRDAKLHGFGIRASCGRTLGGTWVWRSWQWGMWRHNNLDGIGLECTDAGGSYHVGTFSRGVEHGPGVTGQRGCCVPYIPNIDLCEEEGVRSGRRGPCVTKVYGRWNRGRLSGRATTVAPCGIVIVARYHCGWIESIVAMALPARRARQGNPALGRLVIEGLRWRVCTCIAPTDTGFKRLWCQISVPWSRRALDAYVAYVKGGGTCYPRLMVRAVVDLADDTRRLLDGRCEPPAEGWRDFVA